MKNVIIFVIIFIENERGGENESDILDNLSPAEKEQAIRADYQAVIDELFYLCRRITDKYVIFERLRRLISDIDANGAENVFHKTENIDNPWKNAEKTAPIYDF